MKTRAEKQKVSSALAKLAAEKALAIHEPCNCKGRIAHNNGGNYHQVISLKIADSGFYARFDDTCELTPDEEWGEISQPEAVEIIKQYSDWLE